jgi:hypothetical protein
MTSIDLDRDRFDADLTQLIERMVERPTPESPNDRAVVSALVSAAMMHRVAAHLDSANADQLAGAANRAAAELLDDYCGTLPGPHPHGPGVRIVSSLSAIAGTLPTHSQLGNDLRALAGAAASRALGPTRAGSDPMPALQH